MVISSPCLTVSELVVQSNRPGKKLLKNPLMVASFTKKRYGYQCKCLLHEALASPKQTALVKTSQNPFRTYPTPTFTSKLFSNMRRASKGYSGVVKPLFENMLVQAHDEEQLQSPSRITSLPSLSQQPTQSSPSPEPTLPTMRKGGCFMPHDYISMMIDGLEKDLQQTKKIYSTALTKLVLRVNKIEYKLKSGKARRKEKIVLSDDEEIAEDSSKQGRKISQIDEDPTISLVQEEGISWIPQEEEVHVKPSDETKVLVQEETPIEIIEEHRSGERNVMREISTAKHTCSTLVLQRLYAVPYCVILDRGSAKELARKMEEEERIIFNAEQEVRALQEEEAERLDLEAAWELQKTTG
ncbi:hypothetical protein Tco_1255682 [Tanacetum coccineum]